MKEACKLSDGYTLYYRDNGAGGRTYFTDSIPGGVMIWDTCLVDEKTLLETIAFEKQLAKTPITDIIQTELRIP